MTYDPEQIAAAMDMGPGDSGSPVQAVQEYLGQFGYLAKPEGLEYAGVAEGVRSKAAEPGEFDDSTNAALRKFQRTFGLPVTGRVDEATISLMTKPRCGFPDREMHSAAALTSEAESSGFVAHGNRWSRLNLTYGYDGPFTPDVTEAQARSAIQSALRLWADSSPLTFTEVATNPDIRIRFVRGDHGDGSPFDGPGRVLAHAFYPPPNGGDIAGDMHFDDDETWTVALPVPAGGIDLVTVAAHELGHALGLAHSTIAGSLMYPYYGGAQRYLAADDVLGIQTIYGARIHAVPGWFGAEDQGADIAIGRISAPWRQDLVVFHVDNPGGENHGYYRIGYGLDRAGRVTGGWSPVKSVPGWFGAEDQGAGIALGDINGSGRQDLVVFHIDNPWGDNRGYYRIGMDLDPQGNVTGGWSQIHPVPGWFGWENQGAGIALADVNGNGQTDLVVFHLDNPGGENRGYYRIGWNLDKNGAVSGGWSPVFPVPGWFGAENQGGGIAIADVDRNGRPDLIVFHLDNPWGDNHGYYRIGRNLTSTGAVSAGWGPITPLPGWFGWENQGAGIAAADLNGTGRPDLVVFHVDNPGGENHGYYRVITDL